jgi:hypothetical protein
MECLCGISINHDMINVSNIHNINDHFFGIFELKVDFKAGPIIGDTPIANVVSSMKGNLVGNWGIGNRGILVGCG